MQQNNNDQIGETLNDVTATDQQGTCPIFGSNRQTSPQNENDKRAFSVNPAMSNPYYNRPFSENPAVNNPYIQKQNSISQNSPAANTSYMGDYVKGAFIGAAVTYLLTNKKVQDTLFKTAAKTSSLFQMGMEEVKERFEDAKAEVATQNLER